MPNYVGIIKKELKPKIEALIDDIKNTRDKEFFRPTGTQMYCGEQGSGKTITAVKHALEIKARYPKSILVSNLDLKYFDAIDLDTYLRDGIKPNEYVYFQSMDDLGECLTKVNNGFAGVIYLIDEIHTYFNALDSKNIPMYVFTEISQQRKQRKVILATSQLFLRTAKPFREQCDNVIKCYTIFGFITFTKAYDGAALSQDDKEDKDIHVRKLGWYFHTRLLRNAYDTFQKVVSGAEQYSQSVNIIERKSSLLGLKKPKQIKYRVM